MAEYLTMVTDATALGFSMVTIIDRATYACLGASSATAIATAYPDPADATGATQINENQELMEWGTKDGKPKTTFNFYAKKFNILQRFEDGKALVCLKGKDILLGFRFKKIFFMVAAEVASKSVTAADASAASDAPKASFGGAPAAYDKIWKDLWQDMAEDEEE